MGPILPLIIIIIALALPACSGPPDLPGFFIYSAQGQNGSGIFSARADGKKITRILADQEARSPKLATGGRTLFYVTQGSSGAEVASYSLIDGAVRFVSDHQSKLTARLAAEEAGRQESQAREMAEFGWVKPKRNSPVVRYDVAFPSPTPDGRFVSYQVIGRKGDFAPVYLGEAYTVSATGGEPVLIAKQHGAPDWGPQGYLAAGAGRNSIYVRDYGADPLAGRMDVPEYHLWDDHTAQGEIQSLTLSNRGTTLAWIQGSDILTMPLSGGEVTTLIKSRNLKAYGPGTNPAFLAWSPDDKYLACICSVGGSLIEGRLIVLAADGSPLFKQVLSLPIKQIACRLDAFDWVAGLK